MAYQLRLTTKSSATSREKFHLRAGADKAARGGKKRAVTLVAPFISHHLQLQYPGRYTDLFACYEMRAITFANMRRHIHMYIYIYIDLEGKHSVDDFSSSFLFPLRSSAKSRKLLFLGRSRIIVRKIVSVVCVS